MEYYVGLDVSLKQTSICVVNQTGSVVREGVVNSDPKAIAAFVRSNPPGAVRIGLETGSTLHVAMDRAQAAWPSGDLHRRAPRQGGCSKCRSIKATAMMRLGSPGIHADRLVSRRCASAGALDSHSIRATCCSMASGRSSINSSARTAKTYADHFGTRVSSTLAASNRYVRSTA